MPKMRIASRVLSAFTLAATAVVTVSLPAGAEPAPSVPEPAPARPAPTDVPAAEPEVGPPQDTFVSALLYAVLNPTAQPPGVNDFSCRSAEHPDPVVLVHGTVENQYDNWARLAPRLKAEGYCVFALNYGGIGNLVTQATGDIPTSAGQLAAFVDRVRTETGADKVDIVGHSQGGMMPRYYIKNLGGAEKVDSLVALSPSTHGTTLHGLSLLLGILPVIGPCEACLQQMHGSEFITELNAGGEIDPRVNYTVIVTKTDEIVTPYDSQYLPKAPNVANHTLQDYCPKELTEHLGISYNEPATRLVLNALDPTAAQPVQC